MYNFGKKVFAFTIEGGVIVKNVTISILALFLLFGVYVGVFAGETSGRESLESFLAQHFPEAEITTSWQSICEIVTAEYPELVGSLGLEELRLFQDSDTTLVYLEEGAIELINLPISETENHLLLHLHFHLRAGWQRERWPFRPLVLRLDSLEGFVKVPMSEPVSYNDYLSWELIVLDSEMEVLAISGRSGAGGRVGDIDIFVYRDGRYDRIFHRPSAYAQILVDDGPVRITDLNWGSWEDFPIKTAFLDMATASSTWKSRSEFTWDSRQKEFVLTNETPSNFAVVNSFLKAIVEDDIQKAVSFVDSEYAESINFPGDMELLKQFASEQHLALRTTPNLDSSYVSIVSLTGPDRMDSNYTNVKRIVDFKLSELDSPEIVRIDIGILPPMELRPSIKHHVRPTMDFDKEGFEQHAGSAGWENAYSRVVSKTTVESSEKLGEWLHLRATLRSPALLWVESHYAAEIRFESPESAIKNYENTVDPCVVPITVEMSSFSKLALDEDSLRFVLSTDAGHRWEGTFVAESLMEVAFLGINVSGRVFHVEFDTRGNPIDWDLVQTATLHIIRLDKLERADLSWDFGRVLGY